MRTEKIVVEVPIDRCSTSKRLPRIRQVFTRDRHDAFEVRRLDLTTPRGITMGTRAGVWIDHEHATIAFLDDPDRKIVKFKSVARELAETAPKGRAKPSAKKNDFTPEDRLERKAAAEGRHLFDEVAAALSGVGSLLILGPGEAKGEFRKRLIGKKSKTNIADLQTTDKMTDRQVAAHVRAFFETMKAAPVVKAKASRKLVAAPPRRVKAKKRP